MSVTDVKSCIVRKVFPCKPPRWNNCLTDRDPLSHLAGGVLQVHGLSVRYPHAGEVVRDVSGTLSAGTLTAWVGPNAAGKSTLLRACLGLVSPSAGRVLLRGEAVDKALPAWRARRSAYVPQHGGVRFAFTVRDVVAMGRHGRGDARAIDEAIGRCGLLGLEDRAFSELSGGQQRLALVARAYAQSRGFVEHGGGVLLADEPTAGLDLDHAERVMGLLRSAADEGLAVGVVLHDVNHAARFADRVWVMQGGGVVANGSPSEVLVPAVLEPVYGVKLLRLAGPPATLVVG